MEEPGQRGAQTGLSEGDAGTSGRAGHNTICLQIFSRKEEIEITKLLGAPASFIRRPFLYQAMWQSIFSAAVSLGLCGWLLSAVRPLVDAIFKPYGLNIGWRFFHALPAPLRL